ncbi:MAG: type II CRISPR-associated endonuclease Cas1 [Alphaproteobacteria bacterium GM202ARS2]|nr:type II CRISPR-associated endonuclease Cas1 [Alphaproteobacteria bacterium GM202ARS2]
MVGHVLDISTQGRRLALYRGFITISDRDDNEVGRVAINDIEAVIVSAYGVTYSHNILVSLTQHKIIVVLCGDNHAPCGLLLPLDGYYRQSARMQAQAAMKRPLAKRLWQLLVQAKIRHQGAVLQLAGREAQAFFAFANKVRPGDPDNIEAQMARRYWSALFGKHFLRDSKKPGVNGILNYGYAVIRAAVARSVVAAGLHPTLGLSHHNQYNPMCLVDDVMEPFRPLVDYYVARHVKDEEQELEKTMKRDLVDLLAMDMHTNEGHRLAASLARSIEDGQAKLIFPQDPLPLDFAETVRA